MTGPENYREAERLAKESEGATPLYSGYLLKKAQVHATLALAAATALKHIGDVRPWIHVAGDQ